MQFCDKCGSILVEQVCSARCETRKRVEWGESSVIVMHRLSHDADIITQPRKRRADLGGKASRIRRYT